MRLWLKSPVTAVLLAMVVALTSLPGVGLADDDDDKKRKKEKQEAAQQTITPADARPDLKIEYTGFPPNAEYTVTFMVTNVGTARSTAIKAQIQTLSGGPPNLTTPDVPALAPGQSHVLFYGFGNCSGSLTVVLATVNDPLDFPSVNDRAEGEVCADLSALPPIVPESPPVVVAVIEGLLTPEHLRPGAHTLVFTPSASRVVGQVYRDFEPLATDCLNALPLPSRGLETGFLNYDSSGPFGCTLNIIWQAAFRFDLDLLRQARDTGRWLPTDAVLTFRETPYPWPNDQNPSTYPPFHWQNFAGDELPTQTCWVRLAVPTVDWSGPSRDVLPNDVVRQAEQIGRWTVYDQMLGMVVDPEREQRGFLMLGHNEDMNNDSAVCWSRIEDVKLTVTYTMR